MNHPAFDIVFSVSDFVAVLNQTLEFAYPNVIIVGELANFRVSKNRWVYFDLKDEFSSVRFFGTIHMLPGPLEDGMILQVRGSPRLHQLYGFSVNVQTIQPVGEGSIKRAASLLETKLTAEGLFDPTRKRVLSYPPTRIGLITSSESAAYADFIKILKERWGGVEIDLADVQVQGEVAPMQIVRAIEYFNQHAQAAPEVLVITRGGGSAEDLAAFNSEQVVRAIAGSRIPTLVAIGHEVDISLGEMAADQRASTPSNAAQLLVPDKREEGRHFTQASLQLKNHLKNLITTQKEALRGRTLQMGNMLSDMVFRVRQKITLQKDILVALSPEAVLRRGYAIIRLDGRVVRSGGQLKKGKTVLAELNDSEIVAVIEEIRVK